MNPARSAGRQAWISGVAVFLFVVVAQLALVAIAGTDIPFHDQWNIEGQWLYPKWCEGSLVASDLLRPLNEHRILWTHLLNLSLFTVNGQWDPLVQLVAIAILRAACAAGIAWRIATEDAAGFRVAGPIVIGVAFLPHLPWHSVLWGIESQVYFALGFSLLTLALLGAETLPTRRLVAGLLTGLAGLLAMGSAALVPVALFGLVTLRLLEGRRMDRTLICQLGGAAALLGLAMLLRVEVPEHAGLKAHDMRQYLVTAMRILSWPHVNVPLACLVINLPLLIATLGRGLRRRRPVGGEDFVLLVGGWSMAVALAAAWSRGGSPELIGGVPSRYVDFVVLLPLANAWFLVVLAREAAVRFVSTARLLAGAWGVFVLVGWVGLSAEVMRGLVLPRWRDREAPVRLIRAYQITGNAAVFDGQPRLLVPHLHPQEVKAVLDDPRMGGALPPSLQPDAPAGPLSRAVRMVLGRQ